MTIAESYNLCSRKKSFCFFFREEVYHIMELSHSPLIKFSAMPRPGNFIMLSLYILHNIRIHFTLYEKVIHVCLDNVSRSNHFFVFGFWGWKPCKFALRNTGMIVIYDFRWHKLYRQDLIFFDMYNVLHLINLQYVIQKWLL